MVVSAGLEVEKMMETSVYRFKVWRRKRNYRDNWNHEDSVGLLQGSIPQFSAKNQ